MAEMDFYETTARKLIGMEVELSRREKNLPPGYTTGKARIKRYLLKSKFDISSNMQLDCLKDSLQELGYALIELDYQSDLYLINMKNFIINVRQLNSEVIDELKDKAIPIANEFFKAVAQKESQNEM